MREAVMDAARSCTLPWNDDGPVVGVQEIADIARDFEAPGWRVEAEALEASIIPERYLRNLQSIPREAQIKLLRSCVSVVGLGGLGGTLVENLARLGVGRIVGADGDRFEASNLNRQLFSSMNGIKELKADEARRRIQMVNPSIEFTTTPEFLDTSTFPAFFASADVAVDALGGLSDRRDLQHAAAAVEIPMVTGALAGWAGYVSVVLPGSPGPSDFMGHDNAAEEKLGCPAPAVTVFAGLMATQIVEIITSNRAKLIGKMLVVDLSSMQFDCITF